MHLSQGDEDGRQHGEHVGLDESHQQLQTVHEYHQHGTDERKRRAYHGIDLTRDEDDTGQGQNDGMAAHHVGKQTDHQGEGLGENAEQFDDGHHGHGHLEPGRNGRPEDLLPIGFAS